MTATVRIRIDNSPDIALELAGLCYGCRRRPVAEAGGCWCTRTGCAVQKAASIRRRREG